MKGLSRDVIVKFCEICSWTHEVWQFHRTLFDDNASIGDAALNRHQYSLYRLSVITQEYSLHQLAKLHDPAIQGKGINLGLEYVIEFGAWDGLTVGSLRTLKVELDDLADQIRPARNKTLAHNDLATILAGQTVGRFPADADVAYFEALQRFVDLVHDQVVGGPYPFADFARADATELVEALVSAEVKRRVTRRAADGGAGDEHRRG